MFHRLVQDEAALFFTLLAFLTSASIYGVFLWRALRMKRSQVEHFENLPFTTDQSSARHEP